MNPALQRFARPFSLVTLAAALLLTTACHKKPAPVAWPGPEPFTGQLTEVNGVQVILSLKHPKAVNQDLEKLIAGVPEAALLRMGLSRLTAFGYPTFSEIASDSNIGVAILDFSIGDPRTKSTVVIGFAKLKDGGKLGALIGQMGLATQKRGDWVLIAKTPADLEKLKSPDAVTAYLEQPQAADLRVWARSTPEFLASVKARMMRGIQAKIASLPDDEQKASLGYIDAVYAIAAQLHSVEFSLSFMDDGVKFTESAQFLPDSAIGTFLRYKAMAPPAVAQYVSADSVVAFVGRQNPRAAADLTNTILDSLIAVDCPLISTQLTGIKTAYGSIAAASDGGTAGVISFAFGSESGKTRPTPECFIVTGGRFTPEITRGYIKSTQRLTKYFMEDILPKLVSIPGIGATTTDQTFTDNALTVNGIAFDESASATSLKGKEIAHQTAYTAVVDGNLVTATSEKVLQQRLPALVAKIPLADGIHFADAPDDEIMRGTVNGGPLVDLLAWAAKLDLTDDDTKAQISSLKADYAASGPVNAALTVGQARGTITVGIPYKFIATSIRLGQYMRAQKNNLTGLKTAALR